MSIFDKLPADEVIMIENYMNSYGYTCDDEPEGSRAALSYILRYWDDAKETLFHQFGDKFVISKPISYKMPAHTIETKICEQFANENSPFYHFKRQLGMIRIVGDNRPLKDTCNSHYRLYRWVMSADTLAENCYVDEAFEIPTPDGKTIRFDYGCKPVKMLGKVAKAYGISGYEEFRLEHSRLLNQKGLEGEFCLSIHPLDFMTMSDNNNDWSSCMSWQEDGCYRRGTIECMNSPYVVVGYLKSNTDMGMPGGGEWSNKKWRCLFLVTDNVITSVKGYPYQNGEFNAFGVNWLKELCGGDRFDDEPVIEYTYCQPGVKLRSLPSEALPELNVNFYTGGVMYNDFGSCFHTGIFNTKALPKWDPDASHYTNRCNALEIDYSGPAVCIHCGSAGEFPDGEDELCCSECSYGCTCCECGEHISRDEVWYLDDVGYCYSCYCDLRAICALTGEEHYHGNMRRLYLIEDGAEFDPSERYEYPLIYLTEDIELKDYSKYFTVEKPRTATKWWNTFYYLKRSDLTAEGSVWFDRVASYEE